MTTQLTSSHRLVLWILGLAAIAVGLAFLVSGIASVVIALTLCVALWLIRPLLMPPGYGAMKVRTLSLIGCFGLAASYGFWSELANSAVAVFAASPEIQRFAPWLSQVQLGSTPSITVLVFVLLAVWIVNHYMADRSIAGGHPVPINSVFPEETFQGKLDSFCSTLRQHLVTTDREANWSPDYYADLEAEVEILASSGSVHRRQIVDLQNAIKLDRSTRAFLVLGDPGAGKSVALRKISRDMLDEVGSTGRVPIYINLREWLPATGQRDSSWSEVKKPTVQELETFVVDNIKSRGDVFTEEFVDQYFRDLWRHGRLFFIFDSFDEIPELLDVNEESWLINALSEILSRFISSHDQSRGLLASRVFRRPTQGFLAQKILDIRPMSEQRILQGLRRYPSFTPELQATLFRDRSDLVPIARNPFLMALLGEWVKGYGSLPRNQAELYKNYLDDRIQKCSSKMAKAGLALPDVLNAAADIAWFVFESPTYGLEAPVQVIGSKFKNGNVAAIIDLLSYARIGRVTQSEPKSFAFVHRRFLEYLVTNRLLNQPHDIPIEHIPTDSRGRDALVLYAQICDDTAANHLAMLCWSEIKIHFDDDETHLRAIHSLRFLIDAFRSRRKPVMPFERELASFIGAHVARGANIIQAKICLEATGLLSEVEAVPILHMALEGENSWLQETAFRACRHLPTLNPALVSAVADYVMRMPLQSFWNSRRELEFSLSLSESLDHVKSAVTLRYRNLLVSMAAALLACVLYPFATCIALIIHVQGQLIRFALNRSPDRYRHVRAADIQRRELLSVSPLAPPLTSHRVDTDSMVEESRALFGSIVAGSAVVLSAASLLTNSAPVEMDFVNGPLGAMPALQLAGGLILGVGISDWLRLRRLASWVLHELRYPDRKTISDLFLTLAWPVGMGAGIFLVIHILNKFGVDVDPWLSIIGLILCGGVSLWLLRNIWRRGVIYWGDRKRIENIRCSERMSRGEIANAFETLQSDNGRVALVRKIAQAKVVAFGPWPFGFELAVTSDPAITELARLEERWLNLDR